MFQSGARSLIAARLHELGHPPDFVTPAAEAELIGRAAGSKRALREILSATLFVASTEDAMRIEPAHVGQAALDNVPLTARRHVPSVQTWGWSGICVAASIWVVIVATPRRRAGDHAMPPPAPRAVVATLPPKALAPSVAPPKPLPSPATPPKPAPLPAPPANLPERLVAPLVATPAPVLHLFAGPSNAAEAASLAGTLRDAGYQPAILRGGQATSTAGVQVRYYFNEDQALADRIASLAGSAPPQFAPQSTVGTVSPGTIDVVLRAPAPEPRIAGHVAGRPRHAPRRQVTAAHAPKKHGFLASVGRFFNSLSPGRW